MDVLVYLDPSPRGEWALSAAVQLPPRWRGTLRLLATAEDAAADPSLVDRARERLAGAGPVEAVTRPGPAERAVIEEARARRYDLLVVPPAGRGAVARMLKGSRVATVVRSVGAPVLVARRPPERIERVLGALSGRGTTAAVLEAALAWEERPGAHAAFVHVRSEVPLPVGAGEATVPVEVPGGADLEAARHAGLLPVEVGEDDVGRSEDRRDLGRRAGGTEHGQREARCDSESGKSGHSAILP
jgi:nucleotide-binding universal stress UspA family protein